MTLQDLLIESDLVSAFDRLEEQLEIILNEKNIPGCGLLLTTSFLDDILALPKEQRKDAFEAKIKAKGYDTKIHDTDCKSALSRIKLRLAKFDKEDLDKIIAMPTGEKKVEAPAEEHPSCTKPNLKKIADNLKNVSLEIKDIIAANPSIISQANARTFSEIAMKVSIKESTETIKSLEQNCDGNPTASNVLKYIHSFRSTIMKIVADLKGHFDKDPRNETSNKAKQLVKATVTKVQQFN